jgi:hypothetical protein
LELPESFRLIETFLELPGKLPGFQQQDDDLGMTTEPSGIDDHAWIVLSPKDDQCNDIM